MKNKWIVIGLIIGSALGSYIPSLWVQSLFSLSSTIGAFVGGLIGIWLGYKISQSMS